MIKEEFINKINALMDIIEEIAAESDDFKGYKVSPLLKEIVNLLEDNNDKEQDTLGIQFNTYQFVSEVYKRMGRFSLAAKYHEKALDASIVLCTRYNKKLNGIDALLYDILAAGKVPVFGLLKRGGKVYTKVIPDAKSRTLLPIIESKIYPDSIVYTDNFASYDVLDVSDFKHYRINHSTQFVDKKDRQNHINGIENFWNQAKRHMRKFNGIPKAHFELYLKECEWRFNTPSAKQQLTMLKQIVKGKI